MRLPAEALPHDPHAYRQFHWQHFRGPHVDLEAKVSGNFVAGHMLASWIQGKDMLPHEEPALYLLNNMYGNYVGRDNPVHELNGLFYQDPVQFTGNVPAYLWRLHDAGPDLYTYQTLINILRSIDPQHIEASQKQLIALALLTASPVERMHQVAAYGDFVSYMETVSPEIMEHIQVLYEPKVADIVQSERADFN